MTKTEAQLQAALERVTERSAELINFRAYVLVQQHRTQVANTIADTVSAMRLLCLASQAAHEVQQELEVLIDDAAQLAARRVLEQEQEQER